jgi:hypothetical protein
VFASKATLALCYFGVTYLVALAWLATLHDHITDASDEGRARTSRRARVLLVAGIAHPALALAAWDVARQQDPGDDDADVSSARLERTAPLVAVVSASAAAALWSFGGG